MTIAAALRCCVLLAIAGCATVAPVAPPHQETSTGNLVLQGVPELPSALRAELARYQNTRSARFLGWLGDGALIGTRFGNTTQLHRVDTPLGMRRQITFFDEPVRDATVNPNPAYNGFVYVKDVGGSEFYQLFWRDLTSGTNTLLSDGRSRYTRASWSPSGRWLGYSTTERNGAETDLHARDLQGGKRVLQQGEGVGWSIEDWAPGEGRVLISQYLSINEARLYELDAETGQRERLLGHVRAAFGAAAYGEDGVIYFTSDMNSEFRRLHRLQRSTGTVTVLTGDTPWDVETFAISHARDRLAYVTNEDGISRLFVMSLPDAAFVALPALPSGIVSGLRFHPDGTRLGFTVRSATTPADAYSIDFEARTLHRWTSSELGGLRAEDLVEPELIRFPSFDGRAIPAFVYRPRRPGPHPVIVNIHGGPESQARPSFSPSTQFYVHELGAAVIYPNVRGSRGYGKRYLLLDNGRRRENSVRDIGALLHWIAAAPDLDASRVAVTGGSYGGYMVLAALVHYGDRLRAGVERVGISNFVTFLENTQPYRQDLRRAEYGDERDPAMREFLHAISPLNRVTEITTPLLISQGLNDPRVPASESEQMVAALRQQGVPVWYVLAKDEGHGFRKKANRDTLGAATALFLRQRLLADPAGAQAGPHEE